MPVLLYRDLILIRGALTRSYNELEKHYEHGSKELSRAMLEDRKNIAGLLKAIKTEIARRDTENDQSKEKIK